eukprot:3627488-Rhodomonas_salina.1
MGGDEGRWGGGHTPPSITNISIKTQIGNTVFRTRCSEHGVQIAETAVTGSYNSTKSTGRIRLLPLLSVLKQ